MLTFLTRSKLAYVDCPIVIVLNLLTVYLVTKIDVYEILPQRSFIQVVLAKSAVSA